MFIKCLFKWLRDFFYLVTTAEQRCGEKRSSALFGHFFSVFSTPVFRLFRSFQHFPQRIPLSMLSFFLRAKRFDDEKPLLLLDFPFLPSWQALALRVAGLLFHRSLPLAQRRGFSAAWPWRRCAVFPPRCTLAFFGRWKATCFRRWAFMIWSSCAHVAIYK